MTLNTKLIIETPLKSLIRPFLKWAGGKSQIIDKIRDRLPPGQRLIEPFIGAGSVFLNTNYDQYLIADNDLINIFNYLKMEQEDFISYCKEFFNSQYNTKEAFLNVRTEFNETKDMRLKAALFLYLNRHAFNGLMRYNSEGVFNTAFGNYQKPYFPEQEMRLFIKKSYNAQIICSDYKDTMNQAIPGDVIYCDPPYSPLSATANFTQYNSHGFGKNDQEHLVSLAKHLASKGIPVILSNHDTEFVQNLYQGASIISFDVQRNISCHGNNRGKARELIAVFD